MEAVCVGAMQSLVLPLVFWSPWVLRRGRGRLCGAGRFWHRAQCRQGEQSGKTDEVCAAGYKTKEGNFEPICSSFPFMAEDGVAVAPRRFPPLPLCLIDSAARFKSRLKAEVFLLPYNSRSSSPGYYF